MSIYITTKEKSDMQKERKRKKQAKNLRATSKEENKM